MPTRQTYASPANAYYSTQSPQAAAAALTAAMMQAANTQTQVPQLPTFTPGLPPQTIPSYNLQSMTAAQTPYTGQSMQQQGSFAMQMSAPQWNFQQPQFQAPAGPPPSLTEGMADPVAIDRQKAGYVKTLEEQRQHYVNALDRQKKEYLDSIHGQADQLKKQMLMQLDQQVKEQTIALENKYNEQVNTLNQQFHQQRAVLEQEAIKLKGDYQQKQLEEQAMQRQFQLQKERVEMEQKYAADMQQLKQQQYQIAQQSGMYIPPGAVPPAQGSNSYPAGPEASPMGSYVPPVTMPVHQGSYAPPPGGTGSYVPPATTIQAGTGSYVPPMTMLDQQGSYAAPAVGSYVPPAQGSYVPPTQGSYVPPTVVSYTPPEPGQATQSSSYVPSPASAELLKSLPPGAVTQPHYGHNSQQVPSTQVTNYSCASTVHSNISTTPMFPYNREA